MIQIKATKFNSEYELNNFLILNLNDGDLIFSTQSKSWFLNLLSPSPIKHGSIFIKNKIYEMNEFGYLVENLDDYVKKKISYMF